MKLDKRKMKKVINRTWGTGGREIGEITIQQRCHAKTSWDGHGISPLPFTVESLAILEAKGYTKVSLQILDTEGWQVAGCADYRIDEFKVEGEPTWAELKAGRLTLPCSRCSSLPCIHYDDDPHVETAGQCKKCYPGLDDAVLIVTGFYYHGKGLCSGHAEVVYDEFYGGKEELPHREIRKKVTA
jgi:hypothetical protein